MVVGVDDDKFSGLNPTPNLMEAPMCEDRCYLDDWRSVPTTTTSISNLGALNSSSLSTWGSTPSSQRSSFDEPFQWHQQTDSQTKLLQDTNRSVQSSWKTKHPEQWTTEDVTLWICSLMNSTGGCPMSINVAAFLNLTGAELSRMSLNELQNRDPQSGMLVHMALQNVLTQMSIMNFNHPVSTNEAFPFTRHLYESAMAPTTAHMDDMNKTATNGIKCPPFLLDTQDTKELVSQKLTSLDLKLISFDIDDKFDSIHALWDNAAANQQHLISLKKAPITAMKWPNPPMGPPAINTQNREAPTPLASPSTDGSRTPPYNGDSRISCNTVDELSQYVGFADGKGNHLWEFIRDLLFDSRYNPSLVKWEDREEGIFKFVKSDQVAKLWGRKKNNPAMTYEKLSRAMRYYYRRKILERIDGRRLVYKFGPMATGWQP